MFKRILIATDGSGLSEKVIHHGIALAKALNAQVVGVFVSGPLHGLTAAREADILGNDQTPITDLVKQSLSEVSDAATHADLDWQVIHVPGRYPYEGIIETAIDKHCDLIVMGSHGRNALSALVMGSETQETLAHCKIPVLVVH